MNKFFVHILIFVLFGSFVIAVFEENNIYKITCYPDVAFIQFKGFYQRCEYTLKSGSYTGDVAFCFNTPIRDAYVLYNNYYDITSMFKYKFYNISKGHCYYVNDVTWIANETKILDIYYLPLYPFADTKWDTYFGNVSSGRIDLKLDPLWNLTSYKIGNTDSSSNYYWATSYYDSCVSDVLPCPYLCNCLNNSNYVLNNDLNSTNALFYTDRITSMNSFYSNTSVIEKYLSTVNYYCLYGPFESYNFTHNITVNNIIDTFTVYTGIIGDCDSSPHFVLKARAYLSNGSYHEFTHYYYGQSNICRNFKTEFKLPYPYNITNIEMRTCVPSKYRKGYIYNATVSRGVNITIGNASIISNNISLSILVNSFMINASYSGNAFINLTFDGVNYRYMNLSNSSLITLSDDVSDNNRLQYSLFLLDNQTSIYNITINFNGYPSFINITVFNESNGARILQNVIVSVSDGGNNYYYATLVNGVGNISNLNTGNYTFFFSTPGFTTRSYYIPISNRVSNLNVYLNNGFPLLFNVYTSSYQPISNALVSVYTFVNNSRVLVESGLTSTDGRYVASVRNLTYYDYTISKVGYNNLSGYYNPVWFTSYDYILYTSSDGVSYPFATVSFYPKILRVSDTVFNITFFSPNCDFSFYSFYFNNYFYNGSDPCGYSFSIPIDLSNVSYASLYYYYVLSNGASFSDTVYFRILPVTNHTLVDISDSFFGLSIGDRVLISTFYTVLVMGAGFVAFGSGGAIVFGVLYQYYFASVRFIPVEITWFFIVIGIILIIVRGFSK